jgi:energy-converting hydrogenase Eha subunit H
MLLGSIACGHWVYGFNAYSVLSTKVAFITMVMITVLPRISRIDRRLPVEAYANRQACGWVLYLPTLNIRRLSVNDSVTTEGGLSSVACMQYFYVLQ